MLGVDFVDFGGISASADVFDQSSGRGPVQNDEDNAKLITMSLTRILHACRSKALVK